MFLCLTYFKEKNTFQLYSCCCKLHILFLFMAEVFFLIHLAVDEVLSVFHILVIVNNAAINIGVHIYFWISISVFFFFLRYIPKTGVVDLIDRVSEELWTEVCDTVQEALIKSVPKKKKCKKAKWLSEEALKIAEKRS